MAWSFREVLLQGVQQSVYMYWIVLQYGLGGFDPALSAAAFCAVVQCEVLEASLVSGAGTMSARPTMTAQE